MIIHILITSAFRRAPRVGIDSVAHHSRFIGTSLALHWHFIGASFAHHSRIIRASFAHHSRIIGASFAHHSRIIRASLAHHWRIIGTSLTHHWRIIRASLAHHSRFGPVVCGRTHAERACKNTVSGARRSCIAFKSLGRVILATKSRSTYVK